MTAMTAMTATVQNILETSGWSIFGILLLYASMRIYDLLDPINYREEIRRGNIAAGALAAAVTLSIAMIIANVISAP